LTIKVKEGWIVLIFVPLKSDWTIRPLDLVGLLYGLDSSEFCNLESWLQKWAKNQPDQNSVFAGIGTFKQNRKEFPFIIDNIVAWNEGQINIEYEQQFGQHLKITPKNGHSDLYASFSIKDFIAKGRASKSMGHSCFLVDTEGTLNVVVAASIQAKFTLSNGLVVILISHVGQEDIPEFLNSIRMKLIGMTSDKKSLMKWIHLLLAEHPALAETAIVIGVIKRLSSTWAIQ